MSAVRRPSVLKLPHFLLRTKAKTLSNMSAWGCNPNAYKVRKFPLSEQHSRGVSQKIVEFMKYKYSVPCPNFRAVDLMFQAETDDR